MANDAYLIRWTDINGLKSPSGYQKFLASIYDILLQIPLVK